MHITIDEDTTARIEQLLRLPEYQQTAKVVIRELLEIKQKATGETIKTGCLCSVVERRIILHDFKEWYSTL